MIEPKNIIDFHRTNSQLQECFLFCYAVAGKNADSTASKVNDLLAYIRRQDPMVDMGIKGPLEYLGGHGPEFSISIIEHFKFGKCRLQTDVGFKTTGDGKARNQRLIWIKVSWVEIGHHIVGLLEPAF